MDNDIFSSRHYFINKTFMQALGVWPEQPRTLRILIPAILIAINVSLLIPELRKLAIIWGDIDQSMEIMTSVVILCISTAMLVNAGTKMTEFRYLIKRMRSDWESFSKNPPLLTILEKYATEGLAIYGSTFAYIGLPLAPIILNVVVPLNESRPKKFMYKADYGCDGESYYYSILFHSYCVSYTCMSIYTGIDSIFAIWVQHCCALFEIVGWHFKHGAEENDIELGNDRKLRSRNRKMLENLIFCIRQHEAAILFADRIESSFSILMGLVTGLSMVLLSISGVLFVIQINNPDDAVRYTAVVIGLMYHLHHHTVSGQNLINHSSEVSAYAYDCNWYELSLKAQKLVLLILARAQKPCFLTAAKVYIINMENFSGVVKSSVSYFTMLTSIRE